MISTSKKKAPLTPWALQRPNGKILANLSSSASLAPSLWSPTRFLLRGPAHLRCKHSPMRPHVVLKLEHHNKATVVANVQQQYIPTLMSNGPRTELIKVHKDFFIPFDFLPSWINFSFLPHPTYPGMECLMNPVYGLNIEFTNILAGNGSNHHNSSTTRISSLKDTLIDNICLKAFNTPDKTTIMLLALLANSNRRPLCALNNLERAMQYNLTLFLFVNWTTIFIDMNTTPIDIHNCNTIIPTVTPINPAATPNAVTQKFINLFNCQDNSINQAHLQPQQVQHHPADHPPLFLPLRTIDPSSSSLPAKPQASFLAALIVSVMANTVTHTHDALMPHEGLPSTFMTKINNDSHIIWDVLHVTFSLIPNYLHSINQNNEYS
eukprot:jgi/Psemu1/28834/gm1.28834_g